MSAIFGIVHTDGRPVDSVDLEAMNYALLAHGPDGGGTWLGEHVGLGQRLMCFTPEDRFERQPLISRSGKHLLVADARIDNRPELAEELGISAHELREMPDSEIILRAYEKWGSDCPEHLIGPFAFALHDLSLGRLLLARSPKGERALFYHVTPSRVAFASAPCALFALRDVPRQIDEQALADYLVWAPDEPGSCLFKRVSRLQAGCSALIQDGRLKLRSFWSFDVNRETHFPKDADYVEAFNEIFERVVKDHLRSLTPPAIMMSGGLDSTAVAAVAAPLLEAKGQRLSSFTEVPAAEFNDAVMPLKYADETPYVKAMGAMYSNLDPTFVRSDGEFFLNDIEPFFRAAESPFRNAQNRPWWERVHRKAAQKNSRVLLTGLSGNMTVSWRGYGLLPSLLARKDWPRLFGEARALARKRGDAASIMRVLVGQAILPLFPRPWWLAFRTLRSPASIAEIWRRPWSGYSCINHDFAVRQRVLERARERDFDFLRPHRDSRRQRLLGLRTMDTMADIDRGYEKLFGVQTRDPTGDMRLLEFCLSLPEEQYMREGEARWLVRRAMRGRVPPVILGNRHRGLQAADAFVSLRSSRLRIAGELDLIESCSLVRSAIDIPRLRKLIGRIDEAKSASVSANVNYRGVLSYGLMAGRFIAWAESGAS